MSTSDASQPAAATAQAPSTEQIAQHIKELQQKQNFGAAAAAGVTAALLGAALWVFVTVATQSELGLTAIAVGFLVGKAVRKAGQGIEPKFGILAAVLALAGCALGNLLSSAVSIAMHYGTPITDALLHFNFDRSLELFIKTFQPIDMLFYGIAVYEGYRYGYGRIVIRKKV